MGRRGIKEYRAPEALAIIAADREHQPLVCPSCGSRKILRVPRRGEGERELGGDGGGGGGGAGAPERVSLTCQGCGRHASYSERGAGPPRDATMDPRTA